MDDWAVCVGLGSRRTVTARAPRPTTPRRRRSAIGYKKIACSAALFVRGNKESARFAALFADDEFAGESVGIARHALAARGCGKEASHSAGNLGKSALCGSAALVGGYWVRREAR